MLKKILYLIDGTSLCYRSFFAIKLSNSKGFPTGGILGFYKTLKRIISKYNPEYIGVCFDVSRKTFRQEKFKEYKINRPPVPEGLKAQVPLVKELINSLGIKIIEKQGFEADDIIADLCLGAVQDDISVVIASSDKDFCQLLEDDKVSIYNYNKDETFGKEEFLKEFGFAPCLMIDYLSLAGDNADNIPGAKGIGKVGAVKLIKEFGRIENIYKNLDKISSKLGKILAENKDTVFLSKDLVTLRSFGLETSWQDLKVGEPDSEAIYKMFEKLEFKSLLKDFAPAPIKANIEIKEEIPKDFFEQFKQKPLAVSISADKAFFYDDNNKCIYRAGLKSVQQVLKDSRIKKISYAFKKQLKIADIKEAWFDVKIAAFLLNSALSNYSLEAITAHYLGEYVTQASQEIDPYYIYRIYTKLAPLLEKQNLNKLFFEIEMPLVYLLRKMEDDGVKVDADILDDLLKKVDIKIKSNEKKVFEIAEKEFNLNSPKQLQVILFEKLKIPPVKKTKTGYSTNEEVLEKLSLKHAIAEFILEYRQLNKLKTTYIVPLAQKVSQAQGFLHTQFNQTTAQTGRLSSSSPNLQSIPTKGEFSFLLRKAFISSFDSGCILSADYSQIELRILGHLSEDKNLIKAFKEDLDIHSWTASLLFGIETEQVTKEQRNLAKRVNFGIVYGMGAYGLSKELKITPAQAQNFIDDYFGRYAEVKKYIDGILIFAQNQGYVETILGRRRQMPEINSPNAGLRDFARRQAINAPIQGSCADIIKKAMIEIAEELKQKSMRAKLTIQIHDELIFDAPKDELPRLADIVKERMEQSVQLIVPVKVNIKYGDNWGEVR
ncbi:MAG: DNA polymerase I [Candidatus Omnitrophota bacterium]